MVRSDLTPTLILKNYNKEQGGKKGSEVAITEKLKRKISAFKSKLKEKEGRDQEKVLINIEELKNEVLKYPHSDAIPKNIPNETFFYAGSSIDQNEFIVALTSKGPLGDYIPQTKVGPSSPPIDATYKLNNLKYPTIILGTVDKTRKFHLSNSPPFFNKFFFSKV